MSTQPRFDSSTNPLKPKTTEHYSSFPLLKTQTCSCFLAEHLSFSLAWALIPSKTHIELSCHFCDLLGEIYWFLSAKCFCFAVWLAGDWTSPALRKQPDCCCVWAEGCLRGLFRATLSFMVFRVIKLCIKCNIISQQAVLARKEV